MGFLPGQKGKPERIEQCAKYTMLCLCREDWRLGHKTCDILAAERLRLMRFDNRLIIDFLQNANIIKW